MKKINKLKYPEPAFDASSLESIYLLNFNEFPSSYNFYARPEDVRKILPKHYILTHKHQEAGKITQEYYASFLDQVLIEMRTPDEDEENTNVYVKYNTKNPETIEVFKQCLYKKPEGGRIKFLCNSPFGFKFSTKTLKPPQFDMELNYGKEFAELNEEIQSWLLDRQTCGLALLHGKPGTGKSTYLKYLLMKLDERAIYIPPNMVSALTQPDFLGFLSNYSFSVLIVEDAEEALIKRTESLSPTAVSNLLNFADGILGEATKLKILCTFNTEKTELDPAILRPGRLKFIHEFDALPEQDADKLLIHLGKKPKNKSMTLAEIYNEPNGFKTKEKGPIGFSR